jgi:hypothetical protein
MASTRSVLEFKPLTSNRIPRYDILFQHPRLVPYYGDEIRLNRCGVALLDS